MSKHMHTQHQLNADLHENDPELEAIRAERKYNYQDIITVTPEKLPNYEQKVCLAIKF